MKKLQIWLALFIVNMLSDEKQLEIENKLNGYKVDWDSTSTNIRLFRDDAGTRTQLGSSSAQAMSNGDSIGISAVGSTITAWYKASGGSWTAKITQTEATYTAGGRLQWGMWNTLAGETSDNVGVGTVGENGNFFKVF